MNEESLFDAALQIANPDERRAFLDRAGAGDTDLRRRVERLLAADGRPGFLDAGRDAADMLGAYRPPPELQAGQPFAGRFVLRHKLGEGGMGEVWVADQAEPVQRSVAVKVIRPGLGSARLLARFDQERQTLALLDHPNIGKVLDAGVVGDRPFFVMDHIDGPPITRYCEDAELPPRERLRLFLDVCKAVQHAHQKGVIHRDLKPSNILVPVFDGLPLPKVIDFGIAKVTGPSSGGRAQATETGTVVGTLEYMSPEQAEAVALDLDTRSDIYSLGVLLYELLTGGVPFPRERLHRLPLSEMLRVLREEEPPPPSARLTAASRPAAEVRGELDWIVMKCLEKDRERRYETASALAADLKRHLADEPVLAGPPSRGYRARKFLRRHRGGVLAAALLLLTLAGGVVGTAVGLVRETRRAEGERRAKQDAERGVALLASVFEDLDPRAEDRDGRPLRVILGDRLTKAADLLETGSVGDAATVAGLQDRLGLSLLNLGLSEPAVRQCRKAYEARLSLLGEDHPDTLASREHLASSLSWSGKNDEALSLREETLRHRTETLGPTHADTLTSKHLVAQTLRDNGKLALAQTLMAETLRLREETLGPDHADTLASRHTLGLAYLTEGKTKVALPLLDEAYRRRKTAFGDDDPIAINYANSLAFCWQKDGKLAQAQPLFEEALRKRSARFGPDHPETLVMRNNLAMNLMYQKKPYLALLEENLERAKAKRGERHPATLAYMNNLAAGLKAAGKLGDATRLYEESLRLRRQQLGPLHPDTLQSLNNVAAVYREAGKLDLALPLVEEAARGVEKLDFRDDNAGIIVLKLVDYLEQAKRPAEAEAWRRKWQAAKERRK